MCGVGILVSVGRWGEGSWDVVAEEERIRGAKGSEGTSERKLNQTKV